MLSQKIVFSLSLIVLLFAGLLGGGQGFFGDVLAQLSAIALLIACMFNQQSELKTADSTTRTIVFTFIVAVIFVPILQLYPWPSTGEFALKMQHDLQQTGVQLSSFSFNKTYGAERALFGILPACAIFIACLQLPNYYRYRLLAALLLIVALNILLGFAQLAQGPTSDLRLYENTNTADAVGFFANRNHFASLLMMCLPLSIAVTAWCVHQRAKLRNQAPMFIIVGVLFCVLIILGIAVARSRAGLLLGMLGGFMSLLAIFTLPRQRGMKRVLAAALVLGTVVTVQFGMLRLLERFDKGIVDDTRAQMTSISIEAGKAYAPMGSGLGTFRQAYQPFEAKADAMQNTLTNHAHNDYAELWLEAGYPALFAISLFWLLFIVAGVRLWWQQKQSDKLELLLARMAWIGVLLSLIHSAADYPLRTTANMSAFALLLAIALMASYTKKPAQHF